MGLSLLLGPVLFQDFELPQQILWGGRQRLTVHHLPGGARVIDAMGRDDADISWSGIFSGPDAGERAQLVDLLRAGGSVWPLSWDGFFYSVVVGRFRAEYTHANWIPYQISCTVLRDEAEGIVEATLSLAGSVVADIAAAEASGVGLDLSPARAAMSAPGAAIRSTSAYTDAMAAVGAAADGLEGRLQDPVMGLDTLGDAASLSHAGEAARLMAQVTQARGYVLRARANLQNAST